MKLALSPLFHISLCTLGYLYITSDVIQAQVTADDSLNTTVNQNGNVAEITDGTTRGDNLFHSFKDFSVSSGNEAFFNNATNISNIFSRVTGGNVSNIDGLIRANGNASLFLINPQGIIFGEGASLDIGGSFYGSSASSILFEDGEFSAVDLENPPLLTVNAPVGLSFRDNPGEIALKSGTNLKLGESQNIGLIGGAITVDNSTIEESGGISLGGLATSGTVGIDNNGSFNFADSIAKANISIINDSNLSVDNPQEGAIAINGNNIEMNGGFLFAGTENEINLTGDKISLTGVFVNSELFGQGDASAGDINLTANSINLDSSQIINQINTEAKGNTGDINFDTNTLNLNKGSEVAVETKGEGNTGDIKIDTNTLNLNGSSVLRTDIIGTGKAGDILIDAQNISLDDNNVDENKTKIVSQVSGNAEGNIGNIQIDTNTLNLKNGSQILAQITGEAITEEVGNITIDASIIDLNNSEIINQIEPNATGDAGDININASNSLKLDNSSKLLNITKRIGDAGDININKNLDAPGNIEFINSSLLSQVEENATGNSGKIDVTASSLNLDRALWQASTAGEGNAGDININVTENFSLNNDSKVFSQVLPGATGDSGNIKINVDGSLTAINSFFIADSKAQGNSGDITIDVEETIELKGLKIDKENNQFPAQIVTGLDKKLTEDETEIISAGSGDGGSINLKANELIMKDLAFISSNTENNAVGNAGDIIIDVQQFKLTDNAFIAAFTENKDGFDGGSINVNAQNLELRRGGKLYTSTDGVGDAGDINLNIAENITIDNKGKPSIQIKDLFQEDLNNSLQGQVGIFANATEDATGNGGDINIDADFVIALPNELEGNGSDIIANATAGDGGNINIKAESLFGIRERKAVEGNQTNDIDASSEFGLDGNVSIITPVDKINTITELPSNIIEPQETTAQACAVQQETTAASVLTVTGRGGMPPEPTSPLNSENIFINDRAVATSPNPEPKTIPTAQGEIIPARGIVKTADGRIILSSYPTDNQGSRIPQSSGNCS